MKPKIENELERLEKQGTIELIQYSQWATSAVPIMKPDGSVRLCGDYKVTINKVSRVDSYPIPKRYEAFFESWLRSFEIEMTVYTTCSGMSGISYLRNWYLSSRRQS